METAKLPQTRVKQFILGKLNEGIGPEMPKMEKLNCLMRNHERMSKDLHTKMGETEFGSKRWNAVGEQIKSVDSIYHELFSEIGKSSAEEKRA